MASNKASADWWTKTLKDLILHDQIWYNAIRVLVSVESRSDSRIADVALDRLIREGLIDRDEKEVLLAMQQCVRAQFFMSKFSLYSTNSTTPISSSNFSLDYHSRS